MDGSKITRIEIVCNDGSIITYDKSEFCGVGFHEGCLVIQKHDFAHHFKPLTSIRDIFMIIPDE
jgi:hypothetical protein